MTLKEFFNRDDMVIKLDNEDELKVLVCILSKLNITWADGTKLNGEYTEGLIENYFEFPVYFYSNCCYGTSYPGTPIVDFNSIDEFYEEEDLPYISVKSFFESKTPSVIHAGKKDVAVRLLKLFDAAGYKWCTGESYVEHPYHGYDDKQCYSNDNMQSSIKWYQNHIHHKIYEVEDVVDLWEYPKVDLK